MKALSLVVVMAAFSLAACMDLNVVNTNDADAERALATPGDVESLIGATYNTWFSGTYGNGDAVGWNTGASLFMSNQSLQHAPPWANWGMEFYGRIPRVAIANDVTHFYYPRISWQWEYCYRALSSLAEGMRALEDEEVAEGLGPERLQRLKAYARFVQGLVHGTVALFYDRGFVLDETTDLADLGEPLDYNALMAAAVGYFEDAIGLASSASFVLPFGWMAAEVTSQDLVRLAHSYRARLRAQVARTPGERASVDWASVIGDVDAGIQATHMMDMDWNKGWENLFLDYGTWPQWCQLPYFVYGMADQSGSVLEWLDLEMDEKDVTLPGGRPVLIVTPDLRFPQGSTISEQRAIPGTKFRLVSAAEEGATWARPDRGSWRWSWYWPVDRYWLTPGWEEPEILLEEMLLLKAEGLYWQGNRGAAAAIVNETRVAAGLNPTDANGTNTDCVPRLPNGSCGDLWEILKWEKRMETVWTGIAGQNWFFDGRGWGDLWKDTPLHFPMPCQEVEVLQMLPCSSYGGPDGEMGSPGSTYDYPHERDEG
jgi:hypothetical protein